MRNFVYVMTHHDDPNKDGLWGCCDCTGEKRGWNYYAVIGVGGVKTKPAEMTGKLIWIGKSPTKTYVKGKRGPEVTFKDFCDCGIYGPKMYSVARRLWEKIKKAPRGFMYPTSEKQVNRLLKLAKESSANARHDTTNHLSEGTDLCKDSPKDQRRPRKQC